MQISASRLVNAPIGTVFRAVADVNQLPASRPHIIKVEFLSEQKEGVGTRFRETRRMGGDEVDTELEVTEFAADERIRIVADDPGTTWDTVFSVRQEGDQVRLAMVMDARAKRLSARITNKLIKPMVSRAVKKDMDLIKQYCESVTDR